MERTAERSRRPGTRCWQGEAEPAAVLPRLAEQPGSEAKGDGQPSRWQPERLARIGSQGARIGFLIRVLAASVTVAIAGGGYRRQTARERLCRLPLRHPRGRISPSLQQAGDLLAPAGDEIEGREIAMALRRRRDAAL